MDMSDFRLIHNKADYYEVKVENEWKKISWEGSWESGNPQPRVEDHLFDEREKRTFSDFRVLEGILFENQSEPLVTVYYRDFNQEELNNMLDTTKNRFEYSFASMGKDLCLHIPYKDVYEELSSPYSIIKEIRNEKQTLYDFSIIGCMNGIVEILGSGSIDLNSDKLLNIKESVVEPSVLQEYLETNKMFADHIYSLSHETAEFKEEGYQLAYNYMKARQQYNQGMDLAAALRENHIFPASAPARASRRYDSNETSLWNGKRPEEFSMEDTLQYLQETQNLLSDQIKQTENKEEKPMVMVTASKVNLVNKEESNVKAICDIELNNIIQLHGVRIIEGQNGPFVSYPAYKVTDPEAEHPYREYMHFADKATKDMVSGQILKAYQMEYFNRNRQRNISVQCTPLSDGGNVKAIASVSIDEMRIGSLRVMEGKDGPFVAYPSVSDPNSKSGYSDLIIPAKFIRDQINTAVLDAYQKTILKTSETEKTQNPEKEQKAEKKKQTKKPAVPKR